MSPCSRRSLVFAGAKAKVALLPVGGRGQLGRWLL